MDINDAICASPQTGLNEVIIFSQIRIYDGSTFDIVGEELPSDGKAESVEPIVIDKVLHLTLTIHAIVFREWGPGCTCCTGLKSNAEE